MKDRETVSKAQNKGRRDEEKSRGIWNDYVKSENSYHSLARMFSY
jgi:hypothetical protein